MPFFYLPDSERKKLYNSCEICETVKLDINEVINCVCVHTYAVREKLAVRLKIWVYSIIMDSTAFTEEDSWFLSTKIDE